MRTGIICVDFDGTCVTADFPNVGKDVGAQCVLKALTTNGSKLILFTMRGHTSKDWNGNPFHTDVLDDAVKWFRDNDIPLWGMNNNPEQDWTDSPKPFANVIIDDYSACLPEVTIRSSKYGSFNIIDWCKIAEWLYKKEYLTKPQLDVINLQVRQAWNKFLV